MIFGASAGVLMQAAFGVKVEIGDQWIELPAPPGLVRVDGKHRQADLGLTKLAPRGHKVLGVFSTEEALAKIVAEGLRPPGAYYFAQAANEKSAMSAEEFAEFCKSVRHNEQGQDSKANEVWTGGDAPKVSLAKGERYKLGVVYDAPDAIAWMYLHPNGVAASAGVRVRGQALRLVCSAPYASKDDLVAVKEKMRQWIEAVQKEN
jgi:hypothetical protein